MRPGAPNLQRLLIEFTRNPPPRAARIAAIPRQMRALGARPLERTVPFPKLRFQAPDPQARVSEIQAPAPKSAAALPIGCGRAICGFTPPTSNLLSCLRATLRRCCPWPIAEDCCWARRFIAPHRRLLCGSFRVKPSARQRGSNCSNPGCARRLRDGGLCSTSKPTPAGSVQRG